MITIVNRLHRSTSISIVDVLLPFRKRESVMWGKKVVVVFIFMLLMSGCVQSKEDVYITFTVSIQDNEGKFTSENYYFNLKDEEVVLTTKVSLSKQYSYTVFDKYNNCVYYSLRSEDIGDTLFRYDLEKKETTQLSNEFSVIHYMCPLKDQLLIGATLKSDVASDRMHTSLPIMIDLKDNSYHVLEGWDKDQHITDIKYSPLINEFAVLSYSSKEELKNIQEQGMGPRKIPKNYLHTIKGEQVDTLYQTEDEITEVAMNQNKVYFSLNRETLCYSNDRADFEGYIKKTDENLRNMRIIYITNDDRYLYYATGSKIGKYDLQEKEHVVLYQEARVMSSINSAVVLK